MQQILVDFSRECGYQKRGGAACKLWPDEARVISQGRVRLWRQSTMH
jgi:hypothetical protein